MRYFDISEFSCQETGQNGMDKEFLKKLDTLRGICGFPFVITSGFRSVNHSIEIAKDKPGRHTEGIAVDIKCTNGAQRYTLVVEAILAGFTGIGIADSFVHLDTRASTPVIWNY